MLATNEHSLMASGQTKTERRKKNMSKIINGKLYMLVDVVFDDDLIYDIYEDEKGHQIKVPSGYVER